MARNDGTINGRIESHVGSVSATQSEHQEPRARGFELCIRLIKGELCFQKTALGTDPLLSELALTLSIALRNIHERAGTTKLSAGLTQLHAPQLHQCVSNLDDIALSNVHSKNLSGYQRTDMRHTIGVELDLCCDFETLLKR